MDKTHVPPDLTLLRIQPATSLIFHLYCSKGIHNDKFSFDSNYIEMGWDGMVSFATNQKLRSRVGDIIYDEILMVIHED